MKWFKHDSNASRDTKLKRLIMRYGLQGYGLYFYCIERICENVDENKLTFELEDDAEILSHDLDIHVDDINSMMTYMVELRLFEGKDGVITCLRLAKRIDQSMTSSPVMRKLIKKIKENHGQVMTESCLSHDKVMQDKTRLDKTREKESKPAPQKKKAFKKPTIEEIENYCKDRNYAERFFYHYESNGWLVGKNKMKDWKKAIAGWFSRDGKKIGDDITNNYDPMSDPKNSKKIEEGYRYYDGVGWTL